MIVLQLVLFCALFTLTVKLAVGNNALNALYFYPKPVQERVYELGLTDRETVAKKRKRFMIPYGQALLFLEVMNWYDGFAIDRLWVGHSRLWIIPGTDDIPFIQTWKQVFILCSSK